MRRGRAVPIIAFGRIVGYRLSDGKVACLKQRFRSESAALLELSTIRRTSNRTHIPVRAYRCEWCGGWHLTSKPA